MFLACCGLAIGLAFTFLARETHGKAVPQDAEASAPGAVPVVTTPGASLGSDRNGAMKASSRRQG
jgi:hypothetical protein